MKKIILVLATFSLVFALTACSDVCIGSTCTVEKENTVSADNILSFMHVNGHGEEDDQLAYILFEFETLSYVKYQVAYLSCTCRETIVNYWQVMYIEVNKDTGAVQFLSFDEDSEGHYAPGAWGDSSPTPAGKTYADFEADFFPWLVGKTAQDLEGIMFFTNEPYYTLGQNATTIAEQDLIDSFANSSVSTNNMIRVVKAILEYHNDNY